MPFVASTTLLAPFVAAMILVFVPNHRPIVVKSIAAGAGLISTLLSFYMLYAYDTAKGGYQFEERYTWAKELGISFHLGVDGISIPLVLASSLLLLAGVFVSWHIKERPKEFFIFLMVLAAATIGVYVSLDLFFLYFFYEMSVLPMYPLLGVWGSHTKAYLENKDTGQRDSLRFFFNFAQNSKEYAAMKLTLFLSAGAVMALLAILVIYATSGLNSFDIVELQNHHQVPKELHSILFLLIFFGFASIAPLWPLHSWSPVGHAAAPAAVSMLHAGALLKLGHFSIIRVGYTLLPEAAKEWMPLAAVLCLFSIVYGGLVAYFQRDTKYVIGYSSSSHMGYIFLGMAALNMISLTGAVLYMFAHALATGMLFAVAGWVYDQTHTRDIPSLGGLVKKMPFMTGIFILAVAASFGLPGTVNFMGELMILVGSWERYPFQTIVAVLGIGLTLAYLFKMMRQVFFGEFKPEFEHAHDAGLIDRLPLLTMLAASLYFGLFPTQFIEVIQAGLVPLLKTLNGVQTTQIGGPF